MHWRQTRTANLAVTPVTLNPIESMIVRRFRVRFRWSRMPANQVCALFLLFYGQSTPVSSGN